MKDKDKQPDGSKKLASRQRTPSAKRQTTAERAAKNLKRKAQKEEEDAAKLKQNKKIREERINNRTLEIEANSLRNTLNKSSWPLPVATSTEHTTTREGVPSFTPHVETQSIRHFISGEAAMASTGLYLTSSTTNAFDFRDVSAVREADVSAVSEADVSEVEMDSEDEALRKRGWIKKKCHIEDVPNWDASWVVVRSEDLGREMTESEITDLMYQADDRALFRRVFREFEHLYSESQREEIRQQFLRNGDSWTWILKKSYRMLYCAEIIVAPTICDKRHSYWEAIQSEDKPTPTYILFTNVPSLILEEIPDKFTWSAQKPRLDTFQLVWGWVCEKGTGFTHIFYDREKILQKNADKLVVMLFYRKETTGVDNGGSIA
ncbi:hypothetical protein PROFUN_14993 [Planoprotostelium fungivorum]|uniref:Uncharacterized protein n=1 Tax=Planoprotostelium fungivorum TaxID=1890364 RepID=A0A2P6MY90_9EUKA|nr:hypothetical protein PROFUN_14993 [Planoprotostelium fungivorum]